jgi:hypothetical protein
LDGEAGVGNSADVGDVVSGIGGSCACAGARGESTDAGSAGIGVGCRASGADTMRRDPSSLSWSSAAGAEVGERKSK